jgi:glycosyltransferase involved in cell wall biosynthesis
MDLARYLPVAPAPLEGRPFRFLLMSRLLKDKGVREFAAAAARLKADYPDVPVRVAGYIDGSPDSISQAELQGMIDSGVEFLGRLADVRPAIAACSVYVLPSYREGTPRSVLEAMAMGRAIITTDAPGCRETVEEGVNGLLVPPRNSTLLYEAMVRFTQDGGLARRMGSRSREIAEAKYDVRRVNADLMDISGL